MAKQQTYVPPWRKEPGLIGKLLSATTQFIVWLIISLILSILIEWIGMAYFWPEQKESHAKSVLQADQAYLNRHVQAHTNNLKHYIANNAQRIVQWLEPQSRLTPINKTVADPPGTHFSVISDWTTDLYNRYHAHILAAGYVSQTFVIRLTLILFSLPVFALAVLVGATDGLVERDLRRWGGGRESSNVFNLAKRSIVPAFMAACVIYIGLPFSLNPAVVILPFACLYGLAVRIAFERLKKYF